MNKNKKERSYAGLSIINSKLYNPILAIALSLACMLSTVVGVTTAYLVSISGPVESNFTIGNITLELNETTGNTYQLIPGTTIHKDPTVKITAGSEACWLFVKITKSSGFDDYLTYAVEDGWTHLGGFDGIYYRTVDAPGVDVYFNILKDNSITVRDDLTEEKMSAITESPTISFCAYAVQSHSVTDVVDAWLLILAEEGE